MPAEAARRRHTETALAAGADRPELVRRLMQVQGSRPADRAVLSAQAAAGSRYAGRPAARIPRARLVIFPELGHLLCWEDPDRFAGAVTAFLLGGGPRS